MSDANIFGHIVDTKGDHIPYMSVYIKNTTLGTVTDASGHYSFKNLPEGETVIAVQGVGYEPQEKTVIMRRDETQEINFTVKEDALNLQEVVVSAGRSKQIRTEAPIVVNTIGIKMLENTQSTVLGEGLNFCTGLRYENDCQNCGFSQIRMNGMEGNYSQILINSRPVFSGLAGVYGLELIPANMLERIEVVRGGGSVLYGSNAIAGTVNLILREPQRNSFEAGFNTSLIGASTTPDYNANFNASLVTDDYRSGMALFGNMRQREMYDANGDAFSEIAPMKNLVLGARLFHRFSSRNKLIFDFFNIREHRDGGNKQDYPKHERDIAEAVQHDMKTGALTFEQYFRTSDMLSVFASGQFLDRDSYYGANQSLSDYGNTKDKTYNVGAQYKANFSASSLIGGVEHTGSYLTDKKLGYPDYENAVIEDGKIVEIPHTENTIVSDQSLSTYGVFAQYEIKFFDKLKLSAGGRFERYEVKDRRYPFDNKSGIVFIPRATVMYDIAKILQIRAAYSRGYRAPQIFDEDLHIETSGSRKVLHENSADLKQENSSSFTLSFDFNKKLGKCNLGLLVEGFVTQLHNPFRNEIGTPDDEGTVIYTRVNATEGATVQGVNLELKAAISSKLSMNGGFTAQASRYKEAGYFNEKRFFRTPDAYGFITADWDFLKNFCLSLSGNYTGKMLVPYFGATLPEGELRAVGELRRSRPFFDAGARLQYDMRVSGEITIQWFAGVKNIFNSYQTDFDKGIDRDPAYIYGPALPRTIFIGFKIGNLL
ncbi:MAG: TonB-dependent receptor [Bacteroidales bacterium]|jgi:outer membrane receptor for ferrienterochelin and colicins|nr:TonB-dependent receptor [Bacteroidales bacterium]